MKRASILLAMFLLGGCVSDSGSAPDASAPAARSSRASRDEDSDKPRSCEATSIGGEAKTFCY